jgi:hypothetical protein
MEPEHRNLRGEQDEKVAADRDGAIYKLPEIS